MKWTFASPAALLLSAACTTPAPAPEYSVHAIRFETEACYGTCPAFVATVRADGSGEFEGGRFVAAEGAHAFAISGEEFAAFTARLAPFRPETSVTYGYDKCDGPLSTDSPSVNVRWMDEGGRAVSLDWYMGCQQSGLTDHRDEIYNAWQELSGVVALVGTDEERRKNGLN